MLKRKYFPIIRCALVYTKKSCYFTFGCSVSKCINPHLRCSECHLGIEDSLIKFQSYE